MTYLKSKRAWVRWKSKDTPADCEEPKNFPCFVYCTVLSYGYEEDKANYLYESDLRAMLDQIVKP